MPYKDRAKQADYHRKWVAEHPDYNAKWLRNWRKGATTQRVKQIQTKEERRQKQKQARERYATKIQEEAKKVFGTTCYICGRGDCLTVLHEKNGEKHPPRTPPYALENPENFIKLCYKCHKGVHWCMEQLDMSWGEINERVARRSKKV